MSRPWSDFASRERRRQEAEARNNVWRALSVADKIRSLDGRLGVGQGAKRQRQMLSVQFRDGLRNLNAASTPRQ